MTNELLTAVLEDLARGLDHWVDAVCTSVEAPDTGLPWMDDPEAFRRLGQELDGTDDLRLVVSEGMRGLLHSVLTVLDGATLSAEVGRVRLVDDDGNLLAEGLHELFVTHLLDTGRLD